MINNYLLTKKTKYYLIFIKNVLKKYIYGIKINQNQINLYVNVTKLIYIITFLKNSNITNFDKLVDIVVIDNIANINRFEINYVF
jgi:hypothetical protein|tara:strand:- start:777 stop:1031 length:255 start_codon:yes stop_codon:yes gene_type:complete